VLLTRSTIAVKALIREAPAIPIVFVSVGDPVGENFAQSVARLGGNITGFTNFDAAMAGKWLELLKEITPHLRRVAVLFNPKVAIAGGAFFLRPIEVSAPAFDVVLSIEQIGTAADIEGAAAALARTRDGALLVAPDVFTVTHRASIIEVAARYRLPAIYPLRAV
jgi:putative ABC transport system substrate-binding protein